MKRTILQILGGLLVSIALIALLFYFFLFANPIGIHEANTLKWIPILIAIITMYVGGRINRNTPLIYLPILLIPLILFKPFNFIYYPFVIILLVTSILMLLITRAQQKTIYRNLSWLAVGLIFIFHLFNQPLILEKKGFGYDDKGNIVNVTVLWDFSSKEDLRLPNHILEDKNKNDFNLGNLKEKTYFITFWATWCEPCMREKPALNELKKRLEKESNIEFVDISFDTKNKWLEYLKLKNPEGLQLISKDSQATSRKLNFGGIPMYFIVEKNGNYKEFRSFEIAKNVMLKKYN